MLPCGRVNLLVASAIWAEDPRKFKSYPLISRVYARALIEAAKRPRTSDINTRFVGMSQGLGVGTSLHQDTDCCDHILLPRSVDCMHMYLYMSLSICDLSIYIYTQSIWGS